MVGRASNLLKVGAWIWIAGGLAHFVTVDLLALHTRNELFRLTPAADLYERMKDATMSWGPLPFGTARLFSAFSGMSLWLVASMIVLGLFNTLINGDGSVSDVLRRRLTLLNLIAAIAFFLIASTCFIPPAAVGAACSVVVYGAALVRLRAPAAG
jgi:hypothetical protein